MSDHAHAEAVLPVDLGISEGKAVGFAPSAVAGPDTWPIGGINNPVPLSSDEQALAVADTHAAPEFDGSTEPGQVGQ